MKGERESNSEIKSSSNLRFRTQGGARTEPALDD